MSKHQTISSEFGPFTNAPGELSLFGPPPLLEGEDSDAYEELLSRLWSGVKPRDILEEIWIYDAAVLTWETLRWRRLRTALYSEAFLKALAETLRQKVRGKNAGVKLAKKWALQDPEAIARVNKIMASANMTMDTVLAKIHIEKLADIERIDRLETMAVSRRNAALREIDNHRSTLARALREKMEEIEEAEWKGLPREITALNINADKSGS